MSEAQESGSQPDTAVTTPQGDEVAPAPTTGNDQDPNVTAAGERLDRQTRNWRALEKDRDHWREMAMRPTQQPQRAEHAQQESSDAVSQATRTLADFDFDDGKYQAYLIRNAEQRATQAVEKRLQDREREQSLARRIETFNERRTAFAKESPEIDDAVARVGARVSEALADEILESEEGPALTLYLDNNPDLLRRLNSMTERQVAREIARIELNVKSERAKAKAISALKGTAPAPVPKIDGSGAAPANEDFADKTDEDWYRANKKRSKK
jgi:tellurite resistance protein